MHRIRHDPGTIGVLIRIIGDPSMVVFATTKGYVDADIQGLNISAIMKYSQDKLYTDSRELSMM